MCALIELFAVVILTGGMNSNQVEVDENVMKPTKNVKANKWGRETKRKKKPKKSSIHGIDFAAFWAFNIIYVLFNCIYWIKYLTS